jgi:thiol-disulfide isomerase/thioredoxin
MPAASAQPPAARSTTPVDFVPGVARAKEPLLRQTFVEADSTHAAALVDASPGNPGGQFMLSEAVNKPMFERPWLGVSMDRPPDDEPGVLVTAVVADSPAEKGGLRARDIVVLIDDDPVNAPSEVSYLVQSKEVGTDAVVSAVRDGKFLRFKLRLASIPTPSEQLRRQFVGRPAPAWVGAFDGAIEVHWPLSKVEQGSPRLLVFWRPDCPLCPSALPHANRWHAQYKDKLTVLGIAAVGPGEVAREATKLGIQFPTLADPRVSVTLAHHATVVPTMFLIDGGGIVRDALVGAEPVELERMQGAIKALFHAP